MSERQPRRLPYYKKERGMRKKNKLETRGPKNVIGEGTKPEFCKDAEEIRFFISINPEGKKSIITLSSFLPSGVEKTLLRVLNEEGNSFREKFLKYTERHDTMPIIFYDLVKRKAYLFSNANELLEEIVM